MIVDVARVCLSLLLCAGIPLLASGSRAQNPEPQQVIEGVLEPGDGQLEDGSYRDIHTFEGQAGETVTITLESPDFDVFLVLFEDNDNPLAYGEDVDWSNTNALLTQELPATGTYRVVVNSYQPTGQGRYTLRIYRGEQAITPPAPRAETPELEAQQLMQQGFQQVANGDARAGLANLQQAEQLFAQQNNAADQGLSLYGIGAAYDALDQRQQAVTAYQQALDIFQNINDRQGQTNTLNNLGETYQALGQTANAGQAFETALALALEDGDLAAQADAWTNLGITYDYGGQYAKALNAYGEALTLLTQDDNSSRVAVVQNNLGAIYRNLGQYPQAMEQYQQSLALREQVGDPAGMSTILNNIGEIEYLMGNYAEAEAHYQKALQLARVGNDKAGEASVLSNLGQVAGALQQPEQELSYAQQALELARELDDPFREITALNNLGAVYQSQGKFREAVVQYQAQLSLARQARFTALEAETLGKLGSVAYQRGDLPAAETYLHQSITVLESLRAAELTDTSKRTFYETQRTAYDLLQRVLVKQGKTNQALEISERGRAQAFAELLAAGKQGTPPLDMDALKQVAKDYDTTLVEYTLTGPELGLPYLYIWVISPTGEVTFHAESLDGQYKTLLNHVSQTHTTLGERTRGGFTLSAQPEMQTEHLQALYQSLIAPIATALPQDPMARVTVIPQGSLFLVPFVALRDDQGRYLIEAHTLLTAPSIQSLALTRPAAGNPQASPLIVGNPTMPSYWNASQGQEILLRPLAGAEQEAQAVAQRFNTQPLLGAAATETQVKQALPSASLVHLATHGLLEYGQPEASGVEDLPGAIALTPDDQEDGFLTATELSTLPLQANLVVLSACDTGLGQITGDGVAGLSRSLLGAGASSVLVSLWAVPDAPTAALMVEFYNQMEQGLDKAQALRQAMLVTLENHPEPEDWAAFTLVGNAQ